MTTLTNRRAEPAGEIDILVEALAAFLALPPEKRQVALAEMRRMAGKAVQS